MTTNTHVIHAIADALIETHGQDATEWLECGGRAAIEREVTGWRAAIAEATWIDRPEDVLVLRALRHIEHTIVLTGSEGNRPAAPTIARCNCGGRPPKMRRRRGRSQGREKTGGRGGRGGENRR